MDHFSHIVCTFLLIIVGLTFLPAHIRAACPYTGTINASCSFSGTIDGLDAGTGTANTSQLTITNAVLTITAGQTIVVGSLSIGSNGVVAMAIGQNGQIRPGNALWLKGGYYDPDYPANIYPALTQVDGTYRRLNTFTSRSCKSAAACPTGCGWAASTQPGNDSLQIVDVNGNCLSRACAGTSSSCPIQYNSCWWDGAHYNTTYYAGVCSNHSCVQGSCLEIRTYWSGCGGSYSNYYSC